MTGSSDSDVPARSAGVRDAFLDTLRTWAILRVVSVHILAMAPMSLLFWPAPTFVMPGMPLVFFVSGALTLRSLAPPSVGLAGSGAAMSTTAFWRDRFRRLLLPFWVYVAMATAVAVLLDLVNDEEAFSVSQVRAALSFVPLINPINSPMAFDGVVHLWFLVVIAWLLLLAPLLVRMHRRAPVTLLVASFLVAAMVPLYDLHTVRPVFAEVNSIALFQFFFILGFWYTDARLVSLSKPTAAPPSATSGATSMEPQRSSEAAAAVTRWFDGPGAFAVALAAFVSAWLVWRFQEPEFVNASPWVHGLLGLGWLSLILRARTLVLRLAAVLAVPLAYLNRRALTIYLYGWPTTALASKFVFAQGWTGLSGTLVFFGLAMGLLAVCVAVFGPVEDYAARRRGRSRGRKAPVDVAVVNIRG